VTISFVADYLARVPKRLRVVLQTCIYGSVAGLAAVAFNLSIQWFYNLTFVQLAERSKGEFVVGSLTVLLTTSLLTGWLLNRFCKEAAGSGIPQLKLVFWKEFGYMPWRVVIVKFVAGILSIGGGSSLGREGPSVQLAGGLASNVAGLLGEPKQKRRAALVAGAAAGLAAAFNTPLAAITFVLEEIIADLNSRYLGAVLMASVIGALVVHGIIGKQPAFLLGDVAAPNWPVYLLIPVVSATASFVGVIFQNSALGLRARARGFTSFPGWIVPAFGAVLTWAIGCTIWWRTGHLGIFSVGYDDLSAGLNHELGWKLAGLLLAGKLAATILCYGFGGCGGIFSPTLFLGGMTGVLLSGLFGMVVPLETTDHVVLAVVGMSATLGGVVRAPVTGILIAFEMTHEFALVPALMLGALVSGAISHKLVKHSFYDALLQQDGHNIEHVIPPRDLQSWQQLPVSSIANFQPVVIKGMSAEVINEVLNKCPYNFFPLVEDGVLKGILSRQKGEAAVKTGTAPELQKAVTCTPLQTIRELQHLLIESPTGVAVLLDRPEGKVIGLITLHDLLRAEVAMAQQAGKD
jgi:CIC family chloride channel protein